MQEVGGSIPPSSTKSTAERPGPHRLVGLGHRPFTATTGVRIPLGTPHIKKDLLAGSFFMPVAAFALSIQVPGMILINENSVYPFQYLFIETSHWQRGYQ